MKQRLPRNCEECPYLFRSTTRPPNISSRCLPLVNAVIYIRSISKNSMYSVVVCDPLKVKCCGSRWNHLVFTKLHSISLFYAHLRQLHPIYLSKIHLYRLGLRYSYNCSILNPRELHFRYICSRYVRTHLCNKLNSDKFQRFCSILKSLQAITFDVCLFVSSMYQYL